jgi:hypothetical protein
MSQAQPRIFLIGLFIGFFVAHGTAQFLTWTYAARSVPMRALWSVLSAPLVYAAGDLTYKYLLTVVLINSVFWAVGLTYIVARHASKTSNRTI